MSIDESVSNLVSGNGNFHDLARNWSLERHESILEQLKSNPEARSEVFRNYIQALKGAHARARGKWCSLFFDNSDYIIEVVAIWTQHQASQQDMEPHKDFLPCDFILSAGMTAALKRFRIPTALEWRKEAKNRQTARNSPKRHTYSRYQSFSRGFSCGCTDCEERWRRLEAGETQTAAEVLLRKNALDWNEEDLDLLCWVFQWGEFRKRLFTLDNILFLLVGKHDGPAVTCIREKKAETPPFAWATWPKNDIKFVESTERCDERVLMREGRHGYTAIQRYGCNILWMNGRYEPTRDSGELSEILWLCPNSEPQPKEIMQALTKTKDKKTKVYWGLQNPPSVCVLRCFDSQKEIGILGSDWVNSNLKSTQSFASAEEAEREYENYELSALKNGDLILNIRFLEIGASNKQ
jgi:hypothetical protein